MQDDIAIAAGSWIEVLESEWLENPANVSTAWQQYFSAQTDNEPSDEQNSHASVLQTMQENARLSPSNLVKATAPIAETVKFHVEYPSRAIYLIHAWRVYGHSQAQLDPLGLTQPTTRPELELKYYALGNDDLDKLFPSGDLAGGEAMPLRDIMTCLERTYGRHIGPELMHVVDSAKKHWLYERLEKKQGKPNFNNEKRLHIFERIMQAEEFEHFLHTRYMGQKRFSLEGSESLIPMLSMMVQQSGGAGIKEIILGMAHRGRLSVLANVLGKSLSDIFAEFGGAVVREATGQGDVKYHMGFSSDIETKAGIVHLSLAFNPSHLAVISPVVLGSVRARQCRRKDLARRQVMGVLVHGDAAFAGQGVIAESLNLGDLTGYRTGGTIHIVINNQIGFTTNPFDARSTFYCTDIAKMVQAPILHVNGDDPEACCMVMQLAMDYRLHFRSDIVIDLVTYRRHGHNEADAPEVTQPLMYQCINAHPTVATLYREQLLRDGVLTATEAETMVEEYQDCLQQMHRSEDEPHAVNSLQGRWEGYQDHLQKEPNTAIKAALLYQLAKRVHTLPKTFHPARQVAKLYQNRIAMMHGDMPIDWGCAETMAYATLINEGGWVRLSGQDSGRGTFFHRHAIIYDQQTGDHLVPLKQVEQGSMSHFIVVDSMLSEMAVLGFEYGYAVAEPRALVIWEAQYGDFANNAQVIIDQFIAAGESKWQRMCGMVLWLPHGYEGQGAEHSSARLERYLQLCAEENMQVVYPTTPAQVFHVLRRQLNMRMRKPLILMGPKSLLRNKASFSSLADFTDGSFHPVLAEQDKAINALHCRYVVLCTGKVYYDLLAARQTLAIHTLAIIRIERLYPFPRGELEAILASYQSAKTIRWVQEEPENQGANYQIRHHLNHCLQSWQKLTCITRPAAAAPAVGSIARHKKEQESLIKRALA